MLALCDRRLFVCGDRENPKHGIHRTDGQGCLSRYGHMAHGGQHYLRCSRDGALTADGNNDSLCYHLEFNPKLKKTFGSISGGSSFKFGLFQRQEDVKWTTGAPISLLWRLTRSARYEIASSYRLRLQISSKKVGYHLVCCRILDYRIFRFVCCLRVPCISIILIILNSTYNR